MSSTTSATVQLTTGSGRGGEFTITVDGIVSGLIIQGRSQSTINLARRPERFF